MSEQFPTNLFNEGLQIAIALVNSGHFQFDDLSKTNRDKARAIEHFAHDYVSERISNP